MSFQDDTCDFCGVQFDPMGNGSQSIERINGKDMYWDGQCIQGMDAMWSQYSVEQITKASEQFQAMYDKDPIDHDWSQPKNQGLNDTEKLQLRLKQCFLMDRAAQLHRYAAHRQQQTG